MTVAIKNDIHIVRFAYLATSLIAFATSFLESDPLLTSLVCVVLGIVVVSTFLSAAPRTIRSVTGLQFVLAIFLSIAIYNWPLQLKFAISKGALDNCATQLEDWRIYSLAETVVGKRFGVFEVKRYKIMKGQVLLITEDHLSGPSGLLYHRGQMPAPLNESSGLQLSPDWRYTWSD